MKKVEEAGEFPASSFWSYQTFKVKPVNVFVV